MKKKCLVSIATAAAMAVSLTACGGGGGSETTAAAGGEEPAGTTAAESVEAAEGQTVLKWSIWDKDLTAYYQPLVEEFEKQNPDLKIEMVDLGSSDYQTVLGTQLTGSGSDFDIVPENHLCQEHLRFCKICIHSILQNQAIPDQKWLRPQYPLPI